jgi:hypothetical protein
VEDDQTFERMPFLLRLVSKALNKGFIDPEYTEKVSFWKRKKEIPKGQRLGLPFQQRTVIG